mmetsp:Transcript_2441/g.8584  ORF Transcript_2441/g.8584 Transcript_2441/m.8584 type:complete len:206 (+) Transcript_2441:476-1093(+)
MCVTLKLSDTMMHSSTRERSTLSVSSSTGQAPSSPPETPHGAPTAPMTRYARKVVLIKLSSRTLMNWRVRVQPVDRRSMAARKAVSLKCDSSRVATMRASDTVPSRFSSVRSVNTAARKAMRSARAAPRSRWMRRTISRSCQTSSSSAASMKQWTTRSAPYRSGRFTSSMGRCCVTRPSGSGLTSLRRKSRSKEVALSQCVYTKE